jgi:hypothetical protein
MRAGSDSTVFSRPEGGCHGGPVAILCVVLAVGQASSQARESGTDPSRWRRPERDGVNCLFLQLRLLGYDGTYEQVVAAVPGGAERASLGALARAARRLGLELAPTKLTFAELSALRSPVVILFEESEVGRGGFHLLVELTPSQAHLVEGSLIARGEWMPIDRFRRGWTGFALVPVPRSPWWGLGLGTVLGAATAVSAGCAWSGARRLTRGGGRPTV